MIMLPEKYQPKEEVIETDVEIDVDEEMITDARARELMKRNGFTQIGRIKDMAVLGSYYKRLGVIRTTRGDAIWSQQQMMDGISVGMQQARVILTPRPGRKPKGKATIETGARLLTAVGILAKTLTDSQQMVVEMERYNPSGRIEESAPPRATFAAGAVVQPGQPISQTNISAEHVTINQPAASGESPKG